MARKSELHQPNLFDEEPRLVKPCPPRRVELAVLFGVQFYGFLKCRDPIRCVNDSKKCGVCTPRTKDAPCRPSGRLGVLPRFRYLLFRHRHLQSHYKTPYKPRPRKSCGVSAHAARGWGQRGTM
jgi:hypothetical protein